MQVMVIPVYICTTPWKSLMTKCVEICYSKFEGVETDQVLSRLPFSWGFQGSDLFLHAEVGFLLFFLLKGFPGIPKGKGRMRGWGWVGRCKMEWPAKLTVSSFLIRRYVHYPYIIAFCYFTIQGLLSMDML